MWEKVQEQIQSGKRTGKGSAARRRLPIYNSRETMDETDARLEREMQTRRLREKHARDAAWEQARYEQTMRGAREKYQREHAAEKQQRELEERLGYRVPEHAKRTSPLTETALQAQVYEEKAPERRRYLLQRGMNDKQQQELEARADFERFRNDPLMGRFAAQQAGGHAPLAADSFAQQQAKGLPAQLRDMGLARADAYRAAQPAAAEATAAQAVHKYDTAELDNARRVRAEAAQTLRSNRETLADMERIHRTVGRHQGSTAALSPEDAAKYEYWREMGTKPEAVMAEIRAGEAQVQNENAIIRRQGWKDTADVDARRAARLSGRLTAAEAALVRNPQAGTLGAAEALRELYTQRAGLQAELAALDRPGEAGALKVQEVERTRSRVAAELQEVEADIRAGEYALEALRPETMAARAAGEEMGRASGKGLPYLLSLSMARRAELARRAQHNPEIQTNIAPAGARIVYADNDLIRRAAAMTQREVQTYQALLGGKGEEEANAYMETLRPRLEKRVADAEAKEWAARAGSPLGAWLESAGSVLATVGEPAGMLATGLNTLTGRETTPYDPAFAPTRYKQVVRDTVKAGQREQFGDGFLGNLMNLGYDVVTSAGDSTLSMGLGGSVGGGLLMAGASGSGKVWEELLEGRDSRRALTAGMAAALTEGLTEHMGMERVGNVFRAGKNAGSYRLLLTQAARGFLSEALEEAPGPVVDRAVDAWLNPRNNDRTRRVQELVAGGMTPDEAIARTDAEFLLDMGYGMLAGGLSGGMMQGVAGAAGVTRARSYERAMVKAGAAEADARVAAQQLAGIREDAEGEKALDAVAAQMQAQEDRQGEGHTPFQAAARSAGAPVQVVGVAALTEDGMEVELEGGGKAGLDSIQFEKEDVEAAYRHAAAYGDAQTARQYLAGYEASALPETLYHAGFQAAYEAGRNSRPMTEAERVKRHGGMLEPEVYRLAYQAGRDATAAQEVRLALPEALGEEIRTRIGQLPRTYAQGYTGVVYAAKMTRPTKAQAVMIDLLDAYGKAHGVHYTVVDTIGDGGANGVYSDGDGMVVALDAEEGYLTRVATHEGWHYIRSQLGTEAQALQDTVLELLQNTEGYDLEARIREKQEQYKRMQGQELSREDALEELTADALYDAIATPEAMAPMVSRALSRTKHTKKESAFLAALDKMMDFINNFVAEIRALAKKLAGKNPEAQAMLKHEEDWATDILRAYDQLMEKAGKRERKGTKQQSYSLRDVGEDVLHPVEGATVENHAGVFAAQRERLVAWTDGKPKSANAVRELVGESMTPTLEKWLHNQYEKGQNRRIAEPVYREAVEAFLKRDEAQIAANDAKSKAFWAKLRKESVQLHEVKAGANTHEGRGAVGREIVQELMGDAPRVVVHNRDAQVDIYVNRDSVSKTLSYGSNHNTPIGISKAILLKTKEMLADAKYIGSREDYTGNGGQVHYFVSAAQTGNEIRRVVYMAHEAEGRNGSHLYVEEVELLDTKNTGALDTSRPRFPAGAQALTSNHPGTISIPELLQNFNVEFLRRYDLKERGGQKPLQFSLRNVDEDMAEMQRVMEENERLRELVGKLNDTLSAERGNGKHIDRKAVRKIAREMKKEYQSTVSVDDLAANLQKAFDAMASAQSTGDAESAMAAMGAIAKDMLEKSDETDTIMYDEYRELRDYLRKGRMGLTRTQWAEAENLYGSGKSFRKAVFGRWTVAGREDRSATDLSQRWGEMCERWPEMFDADASEGDMVQQVLDALDATAKTHRNPFDMNMKEMVQYVTAEIYGAYMQAPTLNRDAVWRQEEREKREALTRELGEARQELEQARQEVRDDRAMSVEMIKHERKQAEQQVKDARERADREIERANERANERADQQIEKWRKAREVNAERRRDRLEVIRQKARILKRLNQPAPDSFVPYQMRDAVRTLMEALDYREENKVILKKEMLEAALAAYNAVLPQTDGSGEAREDTGNIPLAAFWDGDAAQAMEELAKTADGKKLNQLSPEETRKLLEVLRAYAAMLINENRLFTQGKKETLQKAGGEMIAAMVQRKEHRQHRPGVENLLNVVNRGMLSPGTVFHTVEDTPMGSIWARLREAEGVHTRHVQEGAAYLAEALEKYHAQELVDMSEKKQLEKGVEVALTGGKQKFRVQELMYLYAAMKREKLVGTNHLLGGGIEFQTGSHPGERIGVRTLTESDLAAIQNALTEEQKAFVDHMVRYLSTTTAEWGNQVTRELYGVEKFNEKYYVPFQVSKNALSSDPAKQQENRLKLGRFTKSLTQQARNPLVVQNFIEMWAAHVEQMSDYNAFVLPIEDMTRLINYRDFGDGDQLGMTVREAMRWGMGNQIPDYIMEFLRRLNGNAKAELGGRTVNRLIGAAKGAAVGANLSVAIQQATAVLRAYALVDAKYLTRGMLAGVNPAKLKKTYAQIEQWAPIATQKSWGYFDTNMSRGLYDRARQDMQTKLNDRLGFLSQKGDELAFAMIWEAVKREVADRPGMTRGTDEYFRACGARFTEIVDQTQVVDSIFQRAELATEKGLSKIWTAFMSEPFKQYNLLWRAGWDMKEARASGNRAAIQRAGKQLGRSVGAVAMSSAAAAAMKSIISAMRDRDNEKEEKDENGKTVVVGVRTFGDKYWDALWVNLLDNVWGVMPIFGNMIGALITGERYSGSSMDSAALNSMIALGKAIEQGNAEDAVYRALQVASNVTGVAVGNLYRDAKALALTAVDLMRRDTLAGAAWDKDKPMDVRLKAAAKNYVYAKQPGDGRKASPDLYFDLLLDAWYSGGMGADFQAVATEMLATGATVSGIKSGFKRRLRGCEQKVTAAADAMEAGDLDRYEELVGEVMAMGIGKAAVVSMVRSELEGRKPKEETPQSWELLEAELVGEDAGLYATGDLLATLDRGEMELAKELADRLSEEKDEGSLRASLTGAYKAPYLAAWKAGDAQEMERIRSMLLGLDVGYTAEMLDKWTQAELSGDYREAVESGDAGEIRQAVAALRDAGATDKELRSRLTEDYRQNYMEAWRQGDRAQTASTEKLLEGLGVGYDAEIFRGWRLDSLEDDWEEAVAAQDAGKLRSAADRQKAAGRTDKQVRDKVWAAYGKAWEKALWSGDTAGAARLAKVMTGSGTGWEQADLDKRAVDDAFSYYYDHVKTGELQEARSVLGYLRRAVAEDAMWKRLYGWAKGQMKKLEGKEAEAFAGNLIRMGFSEKTVAGWRE